MFRPQGIKEAAEILRRDMQEGTRKFLVYYDPDIDGLIAGYLVSLFLRLCGIKFEVFINTDRKHGFFLSPKDYAGYTIIAVDFAIPNIDDVMSEDIHLVNIDHHSIKCESLKTFYKDDILTGVVINNQYVFEPEEYRFQSGAGMVFYVLSALDSKFCTDENKALVGITLLSDVRPIENEHARKFLSITYTSSAPMIQYLISITRNKYDFGFGALKMDMNYIDFTFSPKFNALFRLNMGNEAIDAFLNRTGDRIDFTKYRSLQNDIIDLILSKVRGVEGSNFVINFLDISDLNIAYTISNFIGVVCSRIESEKCKTTMVFVKDGMRLLRGSVRGISDVVDYLSIFRRLGLPCEGHQNAFGVLETDISKLNVAELDKCIKREEEKSKGIKNKVVEVENLSIWSRLNNNAIAISNIFCRNQFKVYLRYTGKNWAIEPIGKTGKAFMCTIDGVKVKCFSKDITPENGYILPMLDRGYVNYYLRTLSY